MRTFKLTGVFAAGLICGLLMQWPSASAYDDRGGIAGGGGGGGGGGIAGGSCTADIAPLPNGDGIVNAADLLAVINAWGACPVPCDSSGTWVNAVAPAYQCAGVFFDISGWTFIQSGSSLTVTVSDGGLLEQMTGTIASCDTGGTFTVSKSFPASCTTTYTLTGAFSSATQFTGTFTVTFTGFGCQNCTNHSFNISASKQ